MLDVHPPHAPAHTWKDFFIHIATIVIGLLIAVGLEQMVEAIHHHREVTETNEALRAEIEDNRHAVASQTDSWRWESAELENNLDVLEALRQHPGTPDEKLPGVLVWSHRGTKFSHAAWDAAQSAGVTSLMPRDEITEMESYYIYLNRIDDSVGATWHAMNDASRFEFVASRLSGLTPAQIEEITQLMEIGMERHFLAGVALQNASSGMPKNFPPSVTIADLRPEHKMPFVLEGIQGSGNPAAALTFKRLAAAGYKLPPPNPGLQAPAK